MADPYIRVRINGTLPGGEVWSVNPAFGGDFVPASLPHADLQAAANAVLALNNRLVLPQDLGNLLSTSGAVTDVRLEWYESGERMTDVAVAQLATPAAGFGGLSVPITTAVGVSLRTANIQRTGRGRLFLPALVLPLTDAGRISSTRTVGIANAAADLLSDIADALPSQYPWQPVVFSQKTGQAYVVTSVQVGDVPDNLRARKDTLAEVYATVAL